ncbi:protein S-acyltransferase 11-like [Olea europaea var. sylvestris]|uniref:protein S-acyltransferase 11-like n=1 Tax=Olea europaea var. sylvestris TaxID=158386 RepID=UPI000C1CF46C|nr:protein S-acyltransferase 11-like [Olea europaea var. sylvestris]
MKLHFPSRLSIVVAVEGWLFRGCWVLMLQPVSLWYYFLWAFVDVNHVMLIIKPEDCSTSVDVDHEKTCWGCGLQVLVSPCTDVFKCGWCGAITKQYTLKCENQCFKWRRLRDRCIVSVVLLFKLFFICGGIWAIYPITFSISFFCGVFHLIVAVILSISTLSTFCLAAFRPAGAPPIILWGSYPTVGKGGLENYTFCHY